MFKPLYANGSHMKLNKYTIDIWGVIRNNKGNIIAIHKNKDEYNICIRSHMETYLTR